MSETESIEKCDFLDKTITILASKISLNKIHIWASENIVVLDFSKPGKPTDNAFIESFNGSFRDECLNVNWFLSLEDAWEKINPFKEEYNHFRPHSALGNLTPIEALSWHRRSSKTLL